MIEIVIKFLEKIDSYKKVVILLVLAISSLGLVVAYDVHKTYLKYMEAQQALSVHDSIAPCSIIKIQDNVFLVSIDLPVPVDKLSNQHIFRFSIVFWMDEGIQNYGEGSKLCQNLLAAATEKKIQSTLKHFIDQVP